MVTIDPPAPNPGADAPIVTGSAPSSRLLSRIETEIGTESCPAGITTLAGTVRRAGSLDVSVTVRSLAGGVATLTVPATLPAVSFAFAGTLTAMLGGRLSTYSPLPEAERTLM